MYKVSIIIPVYNVEMYLVHCLDSCLQQDLSYDEYEIIAINDGSTDNSLSILQDYADRYPNLKIVNQDNRKQGAARNRGIEIATGDYIWFVDSDDWLEPNVLNYLYQSALGSDISIIDSSFVVQNNKKIIDKRYWTEKINLLNTNLIFFSTGVQTYIYSRRFLEKNHCRFLENVYIEDNDFTPKTIYLAKKMNVIPGPVYNYRIRIGSVIHSNDPIKCKDMIFVSKSLYDYMESINDKEWKMFFISYIKSTLHFLLFQLVALSRKDRISVLNILRKEVDLLNILYVYGGVGGKIKTNLIRISTDILCAFLMIELFLREIKKNLMVFFI